jgi:DNA-binding helix-hairpin-helix protein with protein kinase domain
MAAQQHAAIAWPTDLLHVPGRAQALAGFLMPRVDNMRPVGEFSSPKVRRERCPLFNYTYLLRTARNLAIAVRALHERGYVIGDLNESNVLVAETALVTMVDTDSFQVWDAEAGVMYRCRVGKPEYTPPELQSKSFAQVDREPAHDRFGLGVLVFQLLMEGTHPFAGVYHGRGEPPLLEQRIAAGHFPHAVSPQVPYGPKPTAPPFETLAPGLRDLCLRCFQDGHFRPSLRPEPQSWQYVLEEAESHLVTCQWNNQHIFGDHLEACPWCERTKLLGGRDPFPSVEGVKRGEHRVPPPRAPGRTTRGRPRRPAPTPTSAPLPNVPTPPPIPPSAPRVQGKKRRPRPLLGDWNDWAWVALTLGGLSVAAAASFHWQANPLSFLCGIFALLTGILGEAKARSPELDGRGKWVARLGLIAGSLALAWCLKTGV